MTNNSFETGVLSVPPFSTAHVTILAYNTTGTIYEAVYVQDNRDALGAGGAYTGSSVQLTTTEVAGSGGKISTTVDGSSQIRYAMWENGGGTGYVYVVTRGFTMHTRSSP